MNAVVNPSTAPTGANPSPGAAPSGGSESPWYQGDAFRGLPPEAAGWLGKYKSPTDAIVGGWNAAKRLGVPPERLVALPEKPDDPAWREVRARIGWVAPEKPEDYGLAVPEGQPAEFAQEIAKAAHELGVPKDVMAKLAEVNARHVEAQQQRVTSIVESAEAEYVKSLGPKGPEHMEVMLRGAMSAGIPAEAIEAAVTAAAVRGGPEAVTALYRYFGHVGEMRREAPFHDGAVGGFSTPESAKMRLEQLGADREWAARALQRGTAEAIERQKLIAAANGIAMDDATARALASGIVRR